ncbi:MULTISPECIES: ketopantoate reductase family protein [Cryobacterium]|uniref:2-dehydropantoate 2-reductase n=1 Tax=Cryobacterium breve TaxID=1259258 RepID=A0ABY2IUZ1_9MICO|nr:MULTISPECIES: ketopantoate reductase family protein [Cryobacterium]TFC90514.1 ketopantoate reductase family protein [Cryobacterium sp. TmT3-12]TFC95433.1 ketopantoate reductase family protein [Cryobacterium breve]
MKIAVIGAGALGGTFATLLARAGHEVTVTARGPALAVIRAEGISLTGAFGGTRQYPLALERLVETPQLTLVCTKAQDAAAAIGDNARVLDGSPVIVVQNGLDGVRTASALLPCSDCFGALSIMAANYTAPGQVAITTAAPTYIGRGTGVADTVTRAWRDVLSSAVPTVALDNFVGAQWTKLVVNMLNALPAITGLSVQEVVDHTGLRRVMTESMRETVRVGMKRGVRFGSLQGLGDGPLRTFSRLPTGLGQVLPLRLRSRMGDVPNLGSTQQSLKRGQLTEIDYLNGAVVREATLAGVRVPVNELLTALVHEVEARGVPLSTYDVLERFAALRH